MDVYPVNEAFLHKLIRRLGSVGIESYLDFNCNFRLITSSGKNLAPIRSSLQPATMQPHQVLDLLADIATFGRMGLCRVVCRNQYATFETVLPCPAGQLPEDIGAIYARQFDAQLVWTGNRDDIPTYPGRWAQAAALRPI